jgi:excisionase family DNA binding protein
MQDQTNAAKTDMRRDKELEELLRQLLRAVLEQGGSPKDCATCSRLAGPEAPRLLTTHQLEALLQLGRSKVYALIASGEIPSIKVGTRAVRVPVESLRSYVLARLQEGRQ